MRRQSYLRWLAGAIALVSLGVWLQPARAHSNLVKSHPQAGAVLAQAPTAIVLTYSEDVDPGLANVRLLDASGSVVMPGPGAVDPDKPYVVRLDLPALAPLSC